MRHSQARTLLLAALAFSTLAACQPNPEALSATQAEPQKPGTKIEAFQPEAGSVVTVAYSEIGNVGKIELEVREVRDNKGNRARGLRGIVRESEYKNGMAYVDEDELGELLLGIDALLEVSGNPSKMRYFEQQYITRGDLAITAFNRQDGAISYSVGVGTVSKAQDFLTREELLRFRDLVKMGQDTLGLTAQP